jgi:hypothetical protein
LLAGKPRYILPASGDELDWTDAQRQKRAVGEYLADLRRRLGYRRVAMALNGNNTNSLA